MPNGPAEFLEVAHGDLQSAYSDWRREHREHPGSSGPFVACIKFVGVLAREIRIWALSAVAETVDGLPEVTATRYSRQSREFANFGTEVMTIGQLQKHHPALARLWGARAADSGCALPSFDAMSKRMQDYLRDRNLTADGFGEGFDRIVHNSKEPWSLVLSGFSSLRNKVIGHDTEQPDQEDVLADARRKLAAEPFLKRMVPATGQWAEWLLERAAEHLGDYHLRSAEQVRDDAKFAAVKELLRGRQPSLATLWYMKGAPENATELFPRLDRAERVENACDERARGREEDQSEIFARASKGLFLPVIGPGFGLPASLDSPGAAEVAARTREVLRDQRFTSLNAFLQKIVRDRLHLVHLGDIPNLSPDAPAAPCGPLAELVGQLASLAADVTAAFGECLSKHAVALTGCCEVALDDSACKILCERIRTSSRLINDQLRERKLPEIADADLGANAIAADLSSLASRVEVCRSLSLMDVDWLTGLVWHTMRWDAPMYPDSEMLHLQLSLGMPRPEGLAVGNMLLRAPAAAGAAIFGTRREVVLTYLTAWSRRMRRRITGSWDDYEVKPAGRRWRNPYRVLARALKLCLEAAKGSNTDSTDSRGSAKNAVFVVDATFDQRMCDALEGQGVRSAVVFPVEIADRSGARYPFWVLRRFPEETLEREDDQYDVLWDDRADKKIDWHDVPRVVVIKPFGAPLERLDDPRLEGTLFELQKRAEFPESLAGKAMPRGGYRIEPTLLLDDVSIIHDVVRAHDSLPPGFRTSIHEATVAPDVYFLGYPLDEQGRRIRMLADLRPGHDQGQKVRCTICYVSQPPPGALDNCYLESAKAFAEFKGVQTPLGEVIEQLATSLDRPKREGR